MIYLSIKDLDQMGCEPAVIITTKKSETAGRTGPAKASCHRTAALPTH